MNMLNTREDTTSHLGAHSLGGSSILSTCIPARTQMCVHRAVDKAVSLGDLLRGQVSSAPSGGGWGAPASPLCAL